MAAAASGGGLIVPSLPVRYRPQAFDEVLGQDLVCDILQKQLAKQDYRPLYLFTGAAGTGKTTVARIFAMRITGSAHGVVEIDAASHSGVDAVMQLREDAYYHPMTVNWKVYIIDEAHAASSSAWSALLTLLENPPKYAVFILCTTDAGKIPPTIMSRAQRYNFQRIGLLELEKRMRSVAAAEERTVDPLVLQAVARRARGGMRDALSMLDALFAYCPTGEVTWEAASALLGFVDEELYWQLVEACATQDSAAVGRVLQYVEQAGRDWGAFFAGWAEHVVRMREDQIMGEPAEGPWSDEALAVEQMARVTREQILAWMDASMDALGKLRYDPLPYLRIRAFFWGLAA